MVTILQQLGMARQSHKLQCRDNENIASSEIINDVIKNKALSF